MGTVHTFTTSATVVESLRAQDTSWNMDSYFDYENIYGIEGLVSSVPSPMCNAHVSVKFLVYLTILTIAFTVYQLHHPT
jgi:hypothetical protein